MRGERKVVRAGWRPWRGQAESHVEGQIKRSARVAVAAALVLSAASSFALGAGGCGWSWAESSSGGAAPDGGSVETLPPPACAGGGAACVVDFEVQGPPQDLYLWILFPGPKPAPRFRFGQATVLFQVRSSEDAALVVEAQVQGGQSGADGGVGAGATHALDLAQCQREDVPVASLSGPGMAATFRCEVPVPWVFPGPQRLSATVALDPTAPRDDLANFVDVRAEDDTPGTPVLEAMSILDAAVPGVGSGDTTGAAGASHAWVGTLHDGLVLLEVPPPGAGDAPQAPDAADAEDAGLRAVVHYPGIRLDEPYDATFAGPQSNYVTALAREPNSPGAGALWVGTWATGVSLFDPGADLASRADDTWTALLPPQLYPPYDPDAEVPEGEDPDQRWVAQDMMETTTALLPDPTGDGLWVGTLNGLFFVQHGGVLSAEALQASPWRRVADGAVLSLEAGGEGAVWVGLSTEVVAEALPDEWPPAEAPLLRVARAAGGSGATAGEGGEGELFVAEPLWPQADGQPAVDAGAVLALASEGTSGAGGALWVGTTAGLFRATAGGDGALGWSDETDAFGLLDADGSRLAVTALAVDGAGALYVGASARCAPDEGALVWRSAGGEPQSLAAGLPDADVVALARVGGAVLASTSQLTTAALDLLGVAHSPCGAGQGLSEHAELLRLSPEGGEVL